jgi:hypothetical protein
MNRLGVAFKGISDLSIHKHPVFETQFYDAAGAGSLNRRDFLNLDNNLMWNRWCGCPLEESEDEEELDPVE